MAIAATAACYSCCSAPLRPTAKCLPRATHVTTSSLCSPWRSLRTQAPASTGARFVSVLSLTPAQRTLRPNNILALDPDFYKIPYVEGVPVGSRLKLWNLPPNCDHGELFEWLNSIENVNAVNLEFTEDPELNAQGVGGFVEFATKSEACMAIVRLDGRKFKGRCIRMDFVEKRPHEREIGGRRNRPNRNYSRSNADYGYGNSTSTVSNFEPTGTYNTGAAGASPGSTATMPPPPRQYAPLPSHRVFVGNLPWRADESTLNDLFSNHGTVLEARVMRDRETGNSRGFGFVAMSTAEELNNAIKALDGSLLDGRAIKVNIASR